MKITRSAASRAKRISWLTTSMVMPPLLSWRMTLSTLPTSSGSRADVGSSNSIIFGSRASARDQELEVGVEIAFGEQHVLGAFLGYRRRSSNEVVSTGLHRWEQSGILGSVNGDVALQSPGEFVGEVDVETLIAATRKIWKCMRRERAIDSGMQWRQFVGTGGHDKK